MSSSPPRYACSRLLRRREIWLPTWRGWLALAALAVLSATGLLLGAYPFLAVHHPMESGAFVVEGWMSQYTIPIAISEIQQRQYSPCFATGGAIEDDSPLASYGTYANLAARRLQDAGFPAVVTIPSDPVPKDRTYTSARDLRRWMLARGGISKRITLFTAGPHARRSRLLFQKAFGSEAEIGVISISPRGYDPARWFSSSQGVREVVGEIIAYLYARLFFWPAGSEPAGA